MDELEKEIKELKENIEQTKKQNKENKKIRNIKIAKTSIKRVAPFIIAGAVSIGTTSLIGLTPLQKSTVTIEEPKYIKEIDSEGNIEKNKVTKQNKIYNPVLKLHSEWTKQESGEYIKKITTWQINKKCSNETIKELINIEKESTLIKLLGNPESTKIEKTNNLSKEDIENNQKYTIIQIPSDYQIITKKESPLVTVIELSYVVIIYIVLSFGICVFRQSTKYDYHKIIQNIKEQYPKIEINIIKQELKEKQKEHKKLVRK